VSLPPLYEPPVNAPTGVIIIRLSVPAGEEWERLARGALSALLREESFQEIENHLTPAEAADAFEQAMIDTWAWVEV
jgi:hypothetical protein